MGDGFDELGLGDADQLGALFATIDIQGGRYPEALEAQTNL